MEPSGVAEARRRARRYASGLSMSSTRVEHVAIVATEIAQNVLRHGGGGQIMVEAFGPPGLEVLTIVGLDEGSGIERLDRMLKDGESTKNSSGTGFGAMLRLSDRLDIDTEPGKGTCVAAEFNTQPAPAGYAADHAGFRLAYPGERRSGDCVAVRRAGSRLIYMLSDALGHGPKAAEVAQEAETAFRASEGSDPESILDQMNDALSGSRGAVAAILSVDVESRSLSYAAVGNITTLMVHERKLKRLPVRDGLLGAGSRKPHVESFEVPEDAIFLMHSDGLSMLRSLDPYKSLLHRTAPVLAARLLDDLFRGRDDASIIAVRMSQAKAL
ncbi:hypothetical protein B5C34_02010 [Pacificimonas flava]|uniref:PPM-type phosphatase domain-containing protein n=2 Tax=Pacificimonas TaxID=1960290 RepID=A0A219B3F2_9SPHN|nr:hypothetical protein B5C34_02010 [Pacificimonas flava]